MISTKNTTLLFEKTYESCKHDKLPFTLCFDNQLKNSYYFFKKLLLDQQFIVLELDLIDFVQKNDYGLNMSEFIIHLEFILENNNNPAILINNYEKMTAIEQNNFISYIKNQLNYQYCTCPILMACVEEPYTPKDYSLEFIKLEYRVNTIAVLDNMLKQEIEQKEKIKGQKLMSKFLNQHFNDDLLL